MTHAEALSVLSQSPDHRVLRRVQPCSEWQLPAAKEPILACIVDVESTGTDTAVDEVIEIGVLPFEYDKATGAVCAVHESQSLALFREPAIPIPEEATRVHGLTYEMVAGHSITHEQIVSAISGCQLVIAHSASFDRQMLERLDPEFESKNWACSYAEIDWRAEGFESSKLEYLLYKSGWFYAGHRALGDAQALLWLLSLPLPKSGRTGLAALLEQSRKPMFLIRAEKTVFEFKDMLKNRAYFWEPELKAWTCSVSDPTPELEWLKASPCWADKWSKVEVVSVPPRDRYSVRGGKK